MQDTQALLNHRLRALQLILYNSQMKIVFISGSARP